MKRNAFAALLMIVAPTSGHAQAIFTTAPPSLSRVTPHGGEAPNDASSTPIMRPQSETSALSNSGNAQAATPDNYKGIASAGIAGGQSARDGGPAVLVQPSPLSAPQQSNAAAVFSSAKVRPSAQLSMTPGDGEAIRALAQDTGVVLRHLTNNIQGFRFAGEISSSEWPVYITGVQARQKIRFQVGYLSAISVMPEASYLTVVINDTIVGRANIRSTHSVRTVSFDIPPNLLQAGFNSIRLTAEQRHRVDCSLAGTYELWTQIDPSQTGLLLPRGEGISTLADLPALSPDSQGSLPIRAVVPGRTNLANVERIVRVAQMISLAGRFEQPVVDIGPLADGEYGVNLVIGTVDEIADLIGDEQIEAISGPNISVLPARQNRRATIIVTGLNDGQVNEALGSFDMQAQGIGAPAGLRAAAAFPGYRMVGGQRVKLRELGVTSEEFSGRLFRAAFNLFMPPDFYSADYAKAELDIAGGYSAGLSKESQIVVSVNGRNAVSLKLPKTSGDVFSRNSLPLPLGALRPGLNRIEIEAQVPMASDSACDPLAAIAGTKRFLFLDSTEIEMPRIARIARMPDLSVTTTGGFPFVGAAVRPKLVVPAPDRETIGAAATVAAHIAIVAGKPIDFELTGAAPAKGAGSVLVVGGANMLDASYFEAAGVDPAMVRNAWGGRFELRTAAPRDEALTRYEAIARNKIVLERNFPASCRMAKPAGGFERMANASRRRLDMNPTASIARPHPPVDRSAWNRLDGGAVGSLQVSGPASGALFDEWNAKVREQGSISGKVTHFLNESWDWAAKNYASVSGWVGGALEARSIGPKLSSRSALLVAQSLNGDTRDDVWTLISAPTSQDLSESVQCLVDPRVWRQVSGRLSILDASEGTVAAVSADTQRLIATQPLTIENTRLITAGWLSLNSHIYVALSLVIGLMLAMTTAYFVRNIGRRSE